MAQSVSEKRPWLAALLAALITGLGHLYLRRLRRAVGWLFLSFIVSLLFVDPAAIDEILAGTANRDVLIDVAPAFFVVGLSVIDAYLLARAQSVRSRSSINDTADSADPGAESISCPHCGKDLDPDLDFCHWCTTPIDDLEREQAEATRDPEP